MHRVTLILRFNQEETCAHTFFDQQYRVAATLIITLPLSVALGSRFPQCVGVACEVSASPQCSVARCDHGMALGE